MPNSGLFIQKIRYLMVLNSGFADPVIIPNLTENKCQKILLPSQNVKIFIPWLYLSYYWNAKMSGKYISMHFPSIINDFLFKTKTQPNSSIMLGKIKYSPVLYYILSEILFYHWCVKMLVESLKSLLLGVFF